MSNKPFYIKDCALSTIATGVRSQALSHFRDAVADIHPSSIYFHFWVGRLRSDYSNDSFHNDFARWSAIHLHDQILTERFNIIDPTDFNDIEKLRGKLLAVIDERLEEQDFVPSTSRGESFQFVRAVLAIFDTPISLKDPRALIEILSIMGENSLYYHFIDARRRNAEGYDDFSDWMESLAEDYSDLIREFHAVNPFFISMEELKNTLINICKSYFRERVRS